MITSLVKRLLGQLGYTVKKRRTAIRRDGKEASTVVNDDHLMVSIHGKDIYEGFPYQDYPFNPEGWGGDSVVFSELINELDPKLVIEVGSWKGASALTIAASLEKKGKGKVLCIDTWLGALEFWEDQSDPERFKSLNCRHGYPQVYFDFLANVCHSKHQSRIVPFPSTSASAALWLMRYSVTADMIYIDASHEEEDVYQDLIDYYDLTNPGGVLFGDDWSWSGVRAAVERFAAENSVQIEHRHDKWLIRK